MNSTIIKENLTVVFYIGLLVIAVVSVLIVISAFVSICGILDKKFRRGVKDGWYYLMEVYLCAAVFVLGVVGIILISI